MPICENCHNEWTWKETFKRSFTLDSKMRCPYCDKDQYITQKSKLKTFFFNMIVLLPLVLNLIFNIPGVILLSLFIILFIFNIFILILLILFSILFIIFILIHPFNMEIGNTDTFGYKS